MVQGENTTVVQYELNRSDRELAQKLRLELRPLIAFRDYHSTTHENGALNPTVESAPGLASMHSISGPALSASRAQRRWNLERRAIGIAISNTTPSANAGLISSRICSIPSSCASTCVRDASRAVIASTERRDAAKADEYRAGRNRRRRRCDVHALSGGRRFRAGPHCRRRPVHRRAAANRRPSSPAITGSATGAATR